MEQVEEGGAYPCLRGRAALECSPSGSQEHREGQDKGHLEERTAWVKLGSSREGQQEADGSRSFLWASDTETKGALCSLAAGICTEPSGASVLQPEVQTAVPCSHSPHVSPRSLRSVWLLKAGRWAAGHTERL